MRAAWVFALLLFSLTPDLARADAIGGPPPCPTGFTGIAPTRHADGGRCEPWRCHHDVDCSARPGTAYTGTCQRAGLCMVNGAATTTCTRIGAACGEAGRCVAAHLCMPTDMPPLPSGGPRSAAPVRETGAGALALGVPIVCVGFVFRSLRRRA